MSDTNSKQMESIDAGVKRLNEVRAKRRSLSPDDFGDAEMDKYYVECAKLRDEVIAAEMALWITLGIDGARNLEDLVPFSGRASLIGKSDEDLTALVTDPATPIDTLNAAAAVLKSRAQDRKTNPTARSCRAAQALASEFGVRRQDPVSLSDLAEAIDNATGLPELVKRLERLEQVNVAARRHVHRAIGKLSRDDLKTVPDLLGISSDARVELIQATEHLELVNAKPAGGGQ